VATITGAPRTKRVTRPAKRIPSAKPPRVRHEPFIPRGPRVGIKEPQQTDSPGEVVPAGEIGTATLPEWYCWWWLTRKRKMTPGVDFEFQSSYFGGRREMGGLVVDFILPQYFGSGLVLNVQGFHWHRYSTQSRANDLLTKIRLQGPPFFFTVVYLAEDDLYERLDYTMTQALKGTQLYQDQV
jgi:hypothetical protein